MFDFLSPKNGPVVEGLQKLETKYAEHQPEYIPLRTLKGKKLTENNIDMVPVISRWTLTDEQRKAVAEGADIFLELSTFHQPLQPIRMAVSDCSGEMFADWFKVCMLNQSAEVKNRPTTRLPTTSPYPGSSEEQPEKISG